MTRAAPVGRSPNAPSNAPPGTPSIALCQACGACCATSAAWPRFTTEDERDIEIIPAALVAANGSGMRCEGDRCAALAGEVGRATACTIYPARPDVCRACLPGDEACAIARRRHGMPLVPPPEAGEGFVAEGLAAEGEDARWS